jgi:hypothetical protein
MDDKEKKFWFGIAEEGTIIDGVKYAEDDCVELTQSEARRHQANGLRLVQMNEEDVEVYDEVYYTDPEDHDRVIDPSEYSEYDIDGYGSDDDGEKAAA